MLDVIQRGFQSDEPDLILLKLKGEITRLNFQSDHLEDYTSLHSKLFLA